MSSRLTGSRVLISPPTAPVLTLDEAKRHLRVDHDDDNDLIQSMIDTVVGQIDPAAGGWLGRALRPQTWELRLSSFHDHDCRYTEFGGSAILLPYPPLIEVVSVIYRNAGGADVPLIEDAGFRVLGEGGRRQAIAPLYGQGWPAVRCDHEAVRIRFTAGYPAPVKEDGDAPAVLETMPAPIRGWLKLQLGALYEVRESFIIGARAQVAELPSSVLGMLDNYHVVS